MMCVSSVRGDCRRLMCEVIVRVQWWSIPAWEFSHGRFRSWCTNNRCTSARQCARSAMSGAQCVGLKW